MTKEFETYLSTNSDLSAMEISQIISLATPQSLRRNEFLFRAGEICHYKTFIKNGLLRTFSITEDGNEHILQFSPEHTWTLDAESYDKQLPSLVSINALEPSDLLLWNKADFNKLLAEIPRLKKLSDKVISHNNHYTRRRLLVTLGASPEEKYNDFTRNFPHLLARLPLRMIASYLGVSLKTLNRVRSGLLKQS